MDDCVTHNQGTLNHTQNHKWIYQSEHAYVCENLFNKEIRIKVTSQTVVISRSWVGKALGTEYEKTTVDINSW